MKSSFEFEIKGQVPSCEFGIKGQSSDLSLNYWDESL